MVNAKYVAVFVFAPSSVLVGCDKLSTDQIAVFPASGSLFVNGRPAAGATVQLTASNDASLSKLAPHAIVEANGDFHLTTYKTGDGAPAGHYALTVRWPGKPKPGFEEGPDQFHGRYADPKRPAREIDINPTPNELGRIDLK